MFYWQKYVTTSAETIDEEFVPKEKNYTLILRSVCFGNHYAIKNEDKHLWDIELLNLYL